MAAGQPGAERRPSEARRLSGGIAVRDKKSPQGAFTTCELKLIKPKRIICTTRTPYLKGEGISFGY